MRLDAMKRQGQRTDLTSNPVGRKLQGVESANIVGKDMGDGQTQVRRYIRLTELLPEILDMVDAGQVAMRPAVELSYIPKLQQGLIWESMDIEGCTPSYAQAIRMRRLSESNKLTSEAIDAIMMEEKPNQKERIVLRGDRFSRLFPPDLPISKREDYVAAAMEHYAKFRERQKTRNDAR
jgi:ParB family chromosome partitioning protein